jgi:hypothetical protein
MAFDTSPMVLASLLRSGSELGFLNRRVAVRGSARRLTDEPHVKALRDFDGRETVVLERDDLGDVARTMQAAHRYGYLLQAKRQVGVTTELTFARRGDVLAGAGTSMSSWPPAPTASPEA